MAISLSSISRNVELSPPRIVLHGPHGIGKTSFGAQAPAPIVLPTEDGLGTLEVDHFPLLNSYGEVVEAIGVLVNEEHQFQTAVIDTVDWLEPMVWAETCARSGEGWSDIEAPGYGKGYLAADVVWREFLDGCNALRTRGMAVILLAHSHIKQFSPPDNDPYDRYEIKLHKRGAALVEEWADVVLFANWQTYVHKSEAGFNKEVARGVGTGRRLMFSEERPAYRAKNRYSLPHELALGWQYFADALSPQSTAISQEAAE